MPQWMLWALSAAMLWFTPAGDDASRAFVVGVSHFVERHGLVVIIALGESVVVVGTGAAGLPIDRGLVVAALLALASARRCGGPTSATRTRSKPAFQARPARAPRRISR